MERETTVDQGLHGRVQAHQPVLLLGAERPPGDIVQQKWAKRLGILAFPTPEVKETGREWVPEIVEYQLILRFTGITENFGPEAPVTIAFCIRLYEPPWRAGGRDPITRGTEQSSNW